MNPENRDGEYLGERSLDLYLREINNTPLLSRGQERKLAERIRAGDEDALHELVKAKSKATGRTILTTQQWNEGIISSPATYHLLTRKKLIDYAGIVFEAST